MIGRFFFFAFLFIYSTVDAQTFQWAKSAGQWVDDIPYESLYDKDGNLYVTGEISYDAKFDNVIAPEWGSFLVKYDQTGKMLWVRFGLGSYNGRGDDLALDSEGNIYVGGSFSYRIKFGNIFLQGGYNSKVFLVKYTPEGEVLWAKVLGNPATSSWDGCGGVTVDQQDNVYITGAFTYNYTLENNVILLDPFIDYWPDGDCFLVKYNKQGDLQWGKVAATPYEDDRAIGLETGADNKIYWGIQPGSGKFKYDNYEMQDWNFRDGGSLILTLTTSGEKVNTLPIYAALESFIVKDRRIVASGSFYKKARFTENIELSSDATDGFLVRYNQDYTPDLVKKLPKNGVRVAVYNNDIFAAGTFYNKFSIDDLSVSTSSRNFFILKLNSIGYAQWIKTADMGLWGSVGLTSIAISDQGAVAITGMYSKAKMQLDGIELVNNSGNDDGDIFVAVIDDHTPNKCPLITPSIDADKKVICEGEKSLLQATGTNNNLIMWYYNGKPYSDPVYSFNSQVSEGGSYYYLLNPNTDCEIKSDTIKIRKINMPVSELNVLPANQNCDNQPVTIRTSASETYTYKWYKDENSLPGEESSSLIAKSTGKYKIIITNEGRCSVTNSTDILILPSEPDFLPDTIFHCLDKKVDIKPTLNYSGWNYEWSSGDVTSEVGLSKDGLYELKIHSGNCEATDRITLVRYKDLWAPNVITPNGDNKNDAFMIKNNDGSVRLSIYDRWGAVIYDKENYTNDWSAGNVSSGVYFYYISDKECRGDDVLKGWLQIIK